VTAAPRPICAKNILAVEIKITHSQPIFSVLRHLRSTEARKQIDFHYWSILSLESFMIALFGT
jgi:hypothetical protein